MVSRPIIVEYGVRTLGVSFGQADPKMALIGWYQGTGIEVPYMPVPGLWVSHRLLLGANGP